VTAAHRCAILDDYQRVALASADWDSLGGDVDVTVFDQHVGDRDRLAQLLAPFDVVVAMRERTPFDRALIERLPALRLLVTTAMRNASIDVAAAAERGIVVCGTGSHPGPAAEHTWALILALARRLHEELPAFRAGRWQTTLGRSLHGATLGIVGIGKIGTHMASVGQAFGMDVLAWSRRLTGSHAGELGIRRAPTLHDLMREADIVTIHLTLTPETRGLVGARELALMKRDALLVNTSRGPIVDERALIEALSSGRLAGAALDVYDREPLPGSHPFRSLANVVATPHIGYVTRENYRAFYGGAVEDIRAWLAGAPIRALAPANA
jgi:phosphoglycerate dehydrogenase-like enzyme